MFGEEVDTDKFLYHYTTIETALEKILPNGNLRFSEIINTNDPRERKNWNFVLTCPSPKIPQGDKYLEIIAEANCIFKRNCKLLCFSSDVTDENANTFNLTINGFKHPRMWAQYAENHRGICLVFEKKKLSKNIAESLKDKGILHHGYVNYTQSIHSYDAFHLNYDEICFKGLNIYLMEHLSKFYRELFFEKNIDWRDECEYRWVIIGNNSNEEYVSIRNAICGVIVGADFPTVYKVVIEKFCQEYKINAAKINWCNGEAHAEPFITIE